MAPQSGTEDVGEGGSRRRQVVIEGGSAAAEPHEGGGAADVGKGPLGPGVRQFVHERRRGGALPEPSSSGHGLDLEEPAAASGHAPEAVGTPLGPRLLVSLLHCRPSMLGARVLKPDLNEQQQQQQQ